MSNILLVYNPVAGKGVNLKWVTKVCKALEDKGHNVLPHPTSEVETAYDICNEFYDAYDIFIIIGGDGTVNSAIQRLVNQEKPIMIVPRGTANVLKNVLNLRIKKIEDIVMCINKMNIEKFPVGKVNLNSMNKFFILMTGIGFDAEVVYKTKKRHSFFNKFFFFKNALKVLKEYTFPRFKINLNNGEKILKSKSCIISNVEFYAGKFRLCKDFDIRSEKLCICSFKWGKKLRGVTYFYYLLRGKLYKLNDVDIFTGNTFKISPLKREDNINFQIDGEKGGTIPLEIYLKNDYINILIPD